MLVLSRKIGEKVVVGTQVVITVLSVKGARVRLGITAPSHVTVWREELARGDSPPDPVPAVPAG
jgi:carbon storage regulator